jgi:hypothetical protein
MSNMGNNRHRTLKQGIRRRRFSAGKFPVQEGRKRGEHCGEDDRFRRSAADPTGGPSGWAKLGICPLRTSSDANRDRRAEQAYRNLCGSGSGHERPREVAIDAMPDLLYIDAKSATTRSDSMRNEIVPATAAVGDSAGRRRGPRNKATLTPATLLDCDRQTAPADGCDETIVERTYSTQRKNSPADFLQMQDAESRCAIRGCVCAGAIRGTNAGRDGEASAG